ncbi:MAG TPA: M20/M25/M40 family metallo-hydrolase [Bacteroidales bacterium]|nr:M20/M25/M40 family metallo-hydrolase [Bacteroidales bacterium]
MKLKTIVVVVSLALLIAFCTRQRVNYEITREELQEHINYLASELLKGRLTGSAGDSLAAYYIRDRLKNYGLKPLFDEGFQRFEIIVSVEPGKNNFLKIRDKDFISGEDFLPASFSENGSLKAEVVFAGYGFNINTGSIKRNDYSGIDVNGKWVMVLRDIPDAGNPSDEMVALSSDRSKVLMAKDLGAAGVILVSGEAFDKDDVLEPLTVTDSPAGIPVIRVKRNIADIILENSGHNISSLEKKLSESGKMVSFTTGIEISAGTEIIKHKGITRNVVMVLPGEDPALKEEYIIIGAHFDHLGSGGKNSSSRMPDTVAVHYGADDNASGVAMLIELAGKLAGTKGSHKRSIVFVAFTGEEKGLLGSKYFTENPPVELAKINAMINLDMVGRLKETRSMQVGGTGTAQNLEEKISHLVDTNFIKPVYTPEGSGPSDHSSFYAKNIPVLFFTTGAHIDYHTPGDTPDKINYEGMISVSDYIFRIDSLLACDTPRLAFREAGPANNISRMPGRRGVTLGIMPDITGSVKNGLRADLVTPGKPADLGGMKKGDIITAINGKPVNNIEDYMFRLSQLKRGDAITVEVLRDGKKIELLIQL